MIKKEEENNESNSNKEKNIIDGKEQEIEEKYPFDEVEEFKSEEA